MCSPLARLPKVEPVRNWPKWGLVDGGAVAFTDDGTPVVNSEIMRRAMEYSKSFDKAILSHSEDLEMTKGAVMNEGVESMRLGLRGYPAAAEEIFIYREIALAKLTGARVHILHVSSAGGGAYPPGQGRRYPGYG